MTLFIKGKRRPRGEDVEVEYGGAAVFHGAEIYLTTSFDLAANTPKLLPFDQIQLDSDSIADIENSKLVIPAGLDGVWHYGFTLACNGNTGIQVIARLWVDGEAWNLLSIDTGSGSIFSLAASAIDRFSAGEELYMELAVGQDSSEIHSNSNGAPARMFAYYLGPES